MASELLSATLRHEFALRGNRWSEDIDDSVGSRLDNVKWSSACNVGYDQASADVLGLDGGPLLPEGEAAVLFWRWRFAVLRIYMQGELAWVGRIWKIALGPLVEDPTIGLARTVSIEARGIAYDLAMVPALVPPIYTEEGATTSATDLIQEAIAQQGGIIRRVFDSVGLPLVDTGQVSAQVGDYWLDIVIRALQTGDAKGIEWTFLVYAPEAGPQLVPRGQGPVRWRYPALGAGVGVVWDGHEYASTIIANYTDASHSSEATVPTEPSIDGLALHHNIPAARTINVDSTSRAGAETAAATYLVLHSNPVAPTDRLTIDPEGASYARLPGGEGALEPGWKVRAGDVIDLEGLLPSDNRWRHMRVHNIEATEYDDSSGVLTITLDQRRIRSRAAEQSVDIRRQWAALGPSRPRGLVAQFRTDDLQTAHTVEDNEFVVETIGVNGQMIFHLVMDTQVKVTYHGLMAHTANTGRLTLGIDLDDEGFDPENDLDRLARIEIDTADTGRRSLTGFHWAWLTAGEHVLRLWSECDAGLAGTDLPYAKVVIEG